MADLDVIADTQDDQDDGAEEQARQAEERAASPLPQLLKWCGDDMPNIAEDLSEQELAELGMRAKNEYEIDLNSRADWKSKAEASLKLALQETQEKQYPWPRASSVIFPLITSATIEFAARAYPAIVQGRNVVKGIVIGQDNGQPMIVNGQPLMNPATGQPAWAVPPGAKRIRADNVGEHMSYQLLDEQPEWEPETDQLLHILPILGCAYRKSYFDPGLGRNRSVLVSALKLVLNYHAKSMETAPRITEEYELYPVEIEEQIRAGAFLPFDFGPAPSKEGYDGDKDAPHDFLEQHRWVDLDGDGYPEPYIVTVHKELTKVVRIVARYDRDGIQTDHSGKILRIDPVHYYTLYQFLPNPESAVYGLGFGHLLRSLNEAINTSLNQMIDAGHLQNTGGGFIANGLSMHAGAVRFQPGEYKQVNASGMPVRDSVYPLPFAGPSPVLFQLLGLLIGAGKEVGGVKDILTGENMPANMPATTALAMIEQGVKQFTAIYKRVYRALKDELKKLYRLNRIYLTDQAGYQIGDTWKYITRDDYAKGSGVEPVSDPTIVTDMQRLGRAQFLLSLAGDPAMNHIEIMRRVLDAAQIERPDAVLVENPQPSPQMVMEMQEKQAEIGRTRAQESQYWSQGILNLAMAKKASTETDLSWYDTTLEHMRISLEAVNAMTRAAQVVGDTAATHMSHSLKKEELNVRRAEIANSQGDSGAGLPDVAPSPMQQNGPAIPPGLPIGPPQGANGPMGVGPSNALNGA